MTTAIEEAPPTGRTIGLALALALAYVAVTLIDFGLIAATRGMAPLDVRLWHFAYLVGYRALLAWMTGAVVIAALGLQRRVRGPWRARLAVLGLLTAVSLAVGAVAFADDFYSYLLPQRILLTAGLSLAPLGLLLLHRLAMLVPAPRRWRWVVTRLPFALLGALAAVANHHVIPFGNPGPHLGLLLLAGLGIGLALAGLPLPTRARPIRGRRAVLGLAAVWAGCSIVIRPPSRVSSELARDDVAAIYPFVVTHWPDVGDAGFPPVALDPAWLTSFAGDPRWFEDLSQAPAVAPTRPLVDASEVIVVLVTIDSFRHDVFVDPRHAAQFPALTALRREAVVFEDVHAPSSSTAPSILSIFTGQYLSALYWTPVPYKHGTRVRYYPVEDLSPRLPELLPAAARSFTAPSIERLRAQYTLTRGIREEAAVDPTEDLMAAEVLPLLGDWVLAAGPGPAFAFVHLMDAHSPYDRAGGEGDAFDRHVRELGLVDAQIGALVAALQRGGVWSRTVLIVAADHGEAFGEHGQTQHGGSLHEEVTRVPLLVRVPGQAAREVREPVSLIDLGPTILDLFQQPTPGSFLGQSLLPLIAGEDVRLTRPIALESTRLHRAIVFRDGMKCIWRSRENQFELYDLRADPGELDNIVETEASAALRVEAVRRFFGAHALARPGYVTPHYW